MSLGCSPQLLGPTALVSFAGRGFVLRHTASERCLSPLTQHLAFHPAHFHLIVSDQQLRTFVLNLNLNRSIKCLWKPFFKKSILFYFIVRLTWLLSTQTFLPWNGNCTSRPTALSEPTQRAVSSLALLRRAVGVPPMEVPKIIDGALIWLGATIPWQELGLDGL